MRFLSQVSAGYSSLTTQGFEEENIWRSLAQILMDHLIQNKILLWAVVCDLSRLYSLQLILESVGHFFSGP